MDDESYFTYKNNRTPGNDTFMTLDKEKTPHNIKNRMKKKYEKKLLVWVAISGRGDSEVFFRPVGLL